MRYWHSISHIWGAGRVGASVLCILTITTVGAVTYVMPNNPDTIVAPSTPTKAARIDTTAPSTPQTDDSSMPSSTQQKQETTPTQHTVRFQADFSGPDRILTNEYVHWNKPGSCPYTSNVWDMTSGTLLIKNGMGYSGYPTSEATSVCESFQQTNSATFRLRTIDSSFENVKISMDYMATNHVDAAGGSHSYDGVHIWLGYKSEYALYAATVFRWDTVNVIKKKIPITSVPCSDPSNGGCYIELTKEVKSSRLSTANTWHHADIFYKHSGISTTIIEVVDGVKVGETTDSGQGGSPYPIGAVGIRGDNTEFYIKSFVVTDI